MSAVAPIPDSRRHPRARARVKVDYRWGTNTGTGFTRDISEGGIFLSAPEVAPLGTQIYLRIYTSSDDEVFAGQPLKVVGVVARAVSRPAGEARGMGINFEVAYAPTREALAEFVTELLAHSGPWPAIRPVPGSSDDKAEYAVHFAPAEGSDPGDRNPPMTLDDVSRAFAFDSGEDYQPEEDTPASPLKWVLLLVALVLVAYAASQLR